MKIRDIETFVVGNPPPGFGGRYFLFVKLVTDTGIEGFGEIYCATFSPHVVEKMIQDTAERHLFGRDPRRIEDLVRRVYGSGYTLRPDVSLGAVLSGLEMACWDILGKEVGKPVHALLGGWVRERLRTYTYLYPAADEGNDFYTDPERSAERAAQYVREGFTAIKFDPAGPYSVYDGRQPALDDLELSERFCARIREAVGDDADLLFGTHGQFTPAGAIRLARKLERFDPLWFEEPVPPENPAGMARVAAATSIPIATGERLSTKYEFARVLEADAAAILQPNLARAGGLLEAKKIAALAEIHQAQIAPHLYNGPIAGAAAIQLAACIPNFLVLEGIRDWTGFHAELLKTPIRWEEGHVIVPDAPGLGVELDEDVARAHPWTGKELHLEMQETAP